MLTSYVTYFTNWRMMNLVIIVMMLAIDAIVYFTMKRDHRSGPFLPLKGIDWLGQLLWASVCVVGAWIFTFGEHYDWWDSREIWNATVIEAVLLAVTIVYSMFKREPYIDPKAFGYRATWVLIFLLLAMSAILAYFVLVRWKWGLRRYFFLTFFMATYYVMSMYFITGTQTDKETMYLAMFALGVSEVMIETVATYWLSQAIPFQHFFMNITIIGFVRCGMGTAAGGAIVHRLFAWATAKHMMVSSENVGALGDFAGHALEMALKESYGVMIVLGIVMLLFIMIASFSTPIVRLLPRLVSVRRWMTHNDAPDPTA